MNWSPLGWWAGILPRSLSALSAFTALGRGSSPMMWLLTVLVVLLTLRAVRKVVGAVVAVLIATVACAIWTGAQRSPSSVAMDRPPRLGHREPVSASSPCRAHDGLPDSREGCTPGAIDPTLTEDVVCD